MYHIIRDLTQLSVARPSLSKRTTAPLLCRSRVKKKTFAGFSQFLFVFSREGV